MLAISDKRSLEPSGYVLRTRSPNSSPVYTWPFVLSKISPPSDLILPPGKSMDDCLIAAETSLIVRSYFLRVFSVTSMLISYGRSPIILILLISG